MNHIRPLRASMVVPVIVVLLAACSGTSSPTAATGASGSTEAPASGPATAAISPTPPSSTNPVAVLPGEPWIAYEGPVPEVGGVGIRVIRPNGRDEHWATPEAPITHNPGASGGGLGDGWQLQPDWSPDGGRIAFVVDTWPAKPSTRDLWVSNADGTGTRRVYQCVSPCSVAQFPAWSPDGTSLLFVRWDRTDRGVDGSVLQRLDLASGTATKLAATTGPEYFFFPRWSPDGASVVTEIDTYTDISDAATLASTAIARVDLTTRPGTVTRLTPPGGQAQYPDWHPLQDLIAYQARPKDDPAKPYALYTMHPDGSGVALFAADELSLTQPTWLPDGSGVILTRVQGDDFGHTSDMVIATADGVVRPATTDGPHFGTHPRLRPVP